MWDLEFKLKKILYKYSTEKIKLISTTISSYISLPPTANQWPRPTNLPPSVSWFVPSSLTLLLLFNSETRCLSFSPSSSTLWFPKLRKVSLRHRSVPGTPIYSSSVVPHYLIVQGQVPWACIQEPPCWLSLPFQNPNIRHLYFLSLLFPPPWHCSGSFLQLFSPNPV